MAAEPATDRRRVELRDGAPWQLARIVPHLDLALEALQEWSAAGRGNVAIDDAARRGRAFFLDHRLYCSHRTGRVVDPAMLRPRFPPGWHHDLLRGLDHFQAADAPPDQRLSDAVKALRQRQRADGTWVAAAPYPGRHWFRLERAGQPSRITTLRALRVLRWWDAAHVG